MKNINLPDIIHGIIMSFMAGIIGIVLGMFVGLIIYGAAICLVSFYDDIVNNLIHGDYWKFFVAPCTYLGLIIGIVIGYRKRND